VLSLTVVAALTLAAPPPKPADKTGRITLWFGDKVESFRPDGGDPTSKPAPAVKDPFRNVISFAPRRKIAVNIESDYKLVVIPLDEYGERYTLKGYVVVNCFLDGSVVSCFPSADGSRIYFNGYEGDEVDRNKRGLSKGFVFEIETRKVKSVSLPEKHILVAVSPDGKSLVTAWRDMVNNKLKTYLVLGDGKPIEILKGVWSVPKPMFSPDGSRLLMEIPDNRTPQYGLFVMDVATRVAKPLQDDLPDSNRPRDYVWSPDGTQWACLWRPKEAAGIAGGGPIQHEYRVYVADLGGNNPKVIYRVDIPDTPAPLPRLFQWK
jgi:WD40 repeat protein